MQRRLARPFSLHWMTGFSRQKPTFSGRLTRRTHLQPGRVASRQDGAVLEARNGVEEPQNFFRAKNNGQLLGSLRHGNAVFHVPFPVESYLVEETEGGSGNNEGTGAQLPVVHKVQLVGTNLLRAQEFR